MNDKNTNIDQLKDLMKQFVQERDWQQFHNPKNLSMSIAIEAAELMEKFQWVEASLSLNEFEKNKQEIENELGDIISYILSFCNATGIDFTKAFTNKLQLNSNKYPVDKCKGKSNKYNNL